MITYEFFVERDEAIVLLTALEERCKATYGNILRAECKVCVEYWKGQHADAMAVYVKFSDMIGFPLSSAEKPPTPNRGVSLNSDRPVAPNGA